MRVQKLLDRLSEMNPEAEVVVKQPNDSEDIDYLIIEDCEEEESTLVTIGTIYDTNC